MTRNTIGPAEAIRSRIDSRISLSVLGMAMVCVLVLLCAQPRGLPRSAAQGMCSSPTVTIARRVHRAQRGNGHGLGRHGAQHGHARRVAFERHAPGGQREQRVAVAHGVHRVDGARQAVVRHGGQPVGLHLGQHRVGRDHADGGVGAREQGLGQVAAQQGAARVEQGGAVFGARAGHGLAGVVVDHVAQRVDRDQRAHRHAADRDRRGADAALHRAVHAEQLAHQRAVPAPTLPSAGAEVLAASQAA
jgi:hypothetical protein